MGRRYTQLSLAERRTIYRMLGDGRSVAAVAERLGRHHSTIYRERARNAWREDDAGLIEVGADGYWPVTAHELAAARRQRLGKLYRDAELRNVVIEGLRRSWSPEQIAGRLALDGRRSRVSHETIYGFVYSPVGRSLDLYRCLESGRRRRRRRFVRKTRGVPLAPENLITNRPLDVGSRAVPGHWEADLMIFRREHGKANVTSLVERQTRFAFLARNDSRHSAPIMARIAGYLAPLPADLRRSVTFDRGTEFARHGSLGTKLGAATYFCDPAAPHQKGTVENTNRRIRRFLPRETDVASLSHRQLHMVARRLNATPRKCLGYRTPAEAMMRAFDTVSEAS
jgi:IS30 family transposase